MALQWKELPFWTNELSIPISKIHNGNIPVHLWVTSTEKSRSYQSHSVQRHACNVESGTGECRISTPNRLNLPIGIACRHRKLSSSKHPLMAHPASGSNSRTDADQSPSPRARSNRDAHVREITLSRKIRQQVIKTNLRGCVINQVHSIQHLIQNGNIRNIFAAAATRTQSMKNWDHLRVGIIQSNEFLHVA